MPCSKASIESELQIGSEHIICSECARERVVTGHYACPLCNDRCIPLPAYGPHAWLPSLDAERRANAWPDRCEPCEVDEDGHFAVGAANAAIQALPLIAHDDHEGPYDAKCPICKESGRLNVLGFTTEFSWVKLPCNHCICIECAGKQAKAKNLSCPFCRASYLPQPKLDDRARLYFADVDAPSDPRVDPKAAPRGPDQASQLWKRLHRALQGRACWVETVAEEGVSVRLERPLSSGERATVCLHSRQ